MRLRHVFICYDRSTIYQYPDECDVPGRQRRRKRMFMAWIILVLSGILEAVWATALGKSEGFTKTAPTIVFLLGLFLSMAGLAYAMRILPVGTAYAVWVGIGASLTVTYAMMTGSETVSILKVAFVLGIIACVIGLKLLHDS